VWNCDILLAIRNVVMQRTHTHAPSIMGPWWPCII
jgi:hypothetical protein